ncbi:MAG: hypothetical protein NC548_48770 [Lachnospiraceae bacterium]|nr:hypothetical protein [Lachnospiraceae bacterium]
MADCMMIGRVAGCRNYSKKDGKIGSQLKVSDDKGDILEFFGNKPIPEFKFGDTVSVTFGINVFNNRPSSLSLESAEVYKK